MSDSSNRNIEAYQSAQNIQKLLDEKQKVTRQNISANYLLEDINNSRNPDPKLLNELKIVAKGYVLRIKLQGIIKMTKNRLTKINYEIKHELDILKTITVCQYCGGTGEIIDQAYERFGRKIHTTISTKPCQHCKGVGEISLGTDLEKIVKEIMEQTGSSNS